MEIFYEELFKSCSVIPSKSLERAQREINEHPGCHQESLSQLRDLMKTDRNVLEYFGSKNNNHLLQYLRARKFKVEKAFELMKGHLNFCRKYPELTENLTLESVRDCLLNGFPGILPSRGDQGEVVLLFSIGDWRREEFSHDTVVRAYLFLLKHLLTNEETQMNGITIVENFKNYTIYQALSMKISELKKMAESVQGTFPVRFRGAHFIYEPWYFSHTFALIRPFLRNKLLNKVYLYGKSLEKFWEKFDPSMIPHNIGGTGPTYDPRPMVAALEKTEAIL